MGTCIECGKTTLTNYCDEHKWKGPDRPQVNPQPKNSNLDGIVEKGREANRDRKRDSDRDNSPFGRVV